MKGKNVKVAAFQFHGSGNLENNLLALERGIKEAAKQKVRVFLTQECALCGYPPVETASVNSIPFDLLNEAISKIKKLAVENNMYIALGTIRRAGNSNVNANELITPDHEELPFYGKRALWGWDAQNFVPGDNPGIYSIDGFKIGVRICFEVRFPEYFRKLFKEDVILTLVSFCDVGDDKQLSKYEIIKSHLITRAVENVMYVMSANSISNHQLAPTCLINPDGIILQSAPKDEEYLMTFFIEEDEPNFGRKGRIVHSRELLRMGI